MDGHIGQACYIALEHDIILAKHVILYWIDGWAYWPSIYYYIAHEYDIILAKHVILYWMDGCIHPSNIISHAWPI